MKPKKAGSARPRRQVRSRAKARIVSRARPHAVTHRAVQPKQVIPRSYEEALLHSIMQGSGRRLDPCSAGFAGMLASLTPSLRSMHFASGMRAGKLLYIIGIASKGRAAAILCLPDFLDMAGYSDIRFDRLGQLFRVRMRAHSCDLTANVHTFEAGLISGFMSAAEGQQVLVTETSCSSNGSEWCSFEQAAVQGSPADPVEAMRSMATRLTGRREDRKGINSYYCNLLWGTLLHGEYGAEMRGVVRHCGAAMRNVLESFDRDPAKDLKGALEMLDLGKVETSKGKTPVLNVSFDRESTSRRFIDMSMSFVDGFLGGRATITEMGWAYSVSMQ